MTNKTEDRFYFGKPRQKTKFGSETNTVNWQARRWLSQATRIKEEEGLEPFRKRVIKRLEEIIKSTDELIRNPKLEEDYGGWSYKELEEELLRVAPYSNVARRWLQANLTGGRFSRPGQPDKFDASSLNRGNFAEASSSPMLGKLLSEKQMPDGGWRAVETGGGALVISFEDGDVAGNFARRVAGRGYSATAPVQAIGRYWNVEVKNGH